MAPESPQPPGLWRQRQITSAGLGCSQRESKPAGGRCGCWRAVPPGVGLSGEQPRAAAVRRRMKRCLWPKQLGTLAEARRYDPSWNRARLTPHYHEVPRDL